MACYVGMETKVKQPKTNTTKLDKAAKIRESFIQYVLEEGKEPPSVFKFMKDLRMKEATFYDHYASFNALQKDIWHAFLHETINMLHQEEAYQNYSGREKMLAFYYTFIEVLKQNRSYVCTVMRNQEDKIEWTPVYLVSFKEKYIRFVNEILNDSKETEEVIERPYLSDRYADALWIQLMFIIRFWIKDDSKGFEKTDAAIEKTANLAFDLMAKSPLDSMIDLAKFLYRNRN